MPSTDVTFDFNQAQPIATSAGYTRAIREKLENEGLVKFRESFIKKIVKTPLSSNLQVSSYKPSEMQEKQNFFYAISQFAQAILYFGSWFRSHFADNVFVIQEVVETTDPTTGAVTKTSNELGDLLKIWNNLTLDQVFASCKIYMNYSTTPLEAQNLNVTWEFLLANIDSDLRAAVLSEITQYKDDNPDAAQSGPMAFWIIANRIIKSTDALAHNVITGIMAMGLIHFKGENVVDCVSTLRHVLLFLGHGTPNSKAPPTLMDILTDIFLRCSNPTFVQYIRNMHDFHSSQIDTPEKLFRVAQEYYNTLLLKPNGWLRNTKTRSAFFAHMPELTAAMQSEVEFLDDMDKPSPKTTFRPPPTNKSPPPSSDGKGPRVGIDVDRKGNPIDRTPPKTGDPTTRINPTTNKQEHWCGKCPHGGRWGNHLESGHDEFAADQKKKRAAWKAKQANKQVNQDSLGSPEPKQSNNPPSMRHASFCRPILSAFQPQGDSDSVGSF